MVRGIHRQSIWWDICVVVLQLRGDDGCFYLNTTQSLRILFTPKRESSTPLMPANWTPRGRELVSERIARLCPGVAVTRGLEGDVKILKYSEMSPAR